MVLWQRIALPLLGICAGLAAAQAVTSTLPTRYEAQSSILLMATPSKDDRSAERSLELAQDLAPTVAKLVSSRAVAAEAATAMSMPEQSVARNVWGVYEPGSQIITIRASAPSAQRAAELADAASQAVSKQLTRLKLGRDTPVTSRVVDPASPATAASFPNPLLNSALGATIGLLAGWCALMLRGRFDDRVREVGQLESRLMLPVVGVLPPLPQRFARHHAPALFARREVAEQTQATVAALSILTASIGRQRLLVAGVRNDDNAALLTALLGLGVAAERRRITVIDGTVRDPVLSGHFPAASFTWQQVADEQLTPSVLTGHPTLTVLPTEPQDCLTPQRIRELGDLLNALDETEEAVLVHAPPVSASSDTAVLARHVDGVLLVVVAGRTRLTEAVRAARLLRRLNLPLVGVIAVGAADHTGHRAARATTGIGALPPATRAETGPLPGTLTTAVGEGHRPAASRYTALRVKRSTEPALEQTTEDAAVAGRMPMVECIVPEQVAIDEPTPDRVGVETSPEPSALPNRRSSAGIEDLWGDTR
ncbi:hypothetical protein [Micromonospora sp. HUAS LYJ1]|uniref:hypothetical protein n=1 Tax=Micromonospora sp. HUAS LYJ1 TaxID=3061626 RepID=UPI0026723F8C|nr:hypothetical protein [Micromonospora sp. HUAS LYJ1]WKU03367.1 hypothetical protein Q2K16_21235 [Micromonospora sp. HUAS LYJ1]